VLNLDNISDFFINLLFRIFCL